MAMSDFFKAPAKARWRNKPLKLTLAERNVAETMWEGGSDTGQISLALRVDESRVYNTILKGERI